MPSDYEEPTIEYVEEAVRQGITDPRFLTIGKKWLDDEKAQYINKFTELLPQAQRNIETERLQAQQVGERMIKTQIEGLPPIARDISSSLEQGITGLLSLISRPISDEFAEAATHDQMIEEQAQALLDPLTPIPDILERGIRGAGRSVTEMLPGALIGGPYGAIALASLSVGNRAITEARDAGLKGSRFYTYVGGQAALEALFASVFQAFGRGGIESLMGKGITRAGIKGAIRQGSVALAEELPEEIMTEFAQALNEKLHGVDPTKWTWDQVKRIFLDTMVQTTIATGAISVASSAARQQALKDRDAIAESLSEQFGWDKDTSLRILERASTSKNFEETLGEEIDEEKKLTIEGLAEWVYSSPENMNAAINIAYEDAEKKTPRKKVPLSIWPEDLPRRGRKVRSRIAADLREFFEVLPERDEYDDIHVGEEELEEEFEEEAEEPEVEAEEEEMEPAPIPEEEAEPEPEEELEGEEVTAPGEEIEVEPEPEPTTPPEEAEPTEEEFEALFGEFGEEAIQEEAVKEVEANLPKGFELTSTKDGWTITSPVGFIAGLGETPQQALEEARKSEDFADYFEKPEPAVKPPPIAPEKVPAAPRQEALPIKGAKEFVKRTDFIERHATPLAEALETDQEGEQSIRRMFAAIYDRKIKNEDELYDSAEWNALPEQIETMGVETASKTLDKLIRDAFKTRPKITGRKLAPPPPESAPAPTPTPAPAPEPETEVKEPPKKKSIPEKAQKARQDVKDTLKEISDYLDDVTFANPMADPKLWKLTGKLTYQSVKAGYYTFAELIQNTVDAIGVAKTRILRPLLERGWEKLRATGKFEKLTPVENVDHILGVEGVEEPSDVDEGGRKEDQERGEEEPPIRTEPGGAEPGIDVGEVEGAAPEDVEGPGERGPGEAPGEAPGGEGVRGDVGEPEGAPPGGRPGVGGEELVPGGRGGRRPGDTGVDLDSGPSREDGEPTSADAQPNYRITDPEALVGGSQRQKFERNKRAIEVYQDVTDEGRIATEEERDALAAYVGWGAFGQELFKGSWEYPSPKTGWEGADKWLREHLGEKGWKSAQRSIINAHYTDPPTITAMWKMIQRAGFKGGRVLEPAMGTGNFFGLMPDALMARSDLTGIELDEITGGIARLLYPQANISIKGYQESRTPDDFYDLVIGNWPFSAESPADRRYNKLNPTLHDYFFLKALDQVRPGGLVIGITSSGTMDKVGTKSRLEMSKKANLIASYRLPTGAFGKYAGTQVVTDIIVFQKKDATQQAKLGVPDWVQTAKIKTPAGPVIRVNTYYEQNPENVLGTLNWGHGTTRGAPGMIVDRPANYEEQLTNLPNRFPEGIYTERTIAKPERYVTSNTEDRYNSIVVGDDGNIYVAQGEHMVRLEDRVSYTVKNKSQTAYRKAQLKALVGIRKQYGLLLDKQREGAEDTEAARKELKRLYDSFVSKYGPVRSSLALGWFRKIGEPHYARLAALEPTISPPGEKPIKYGQAAILTRSTTRPTPRPERLSVQDAYMFQRNEGLYLDVERIAALAKTNVRSVERELVKRDIAYIVPAGVWEHADEYLSGNVRIKLREAKAARDQGIEGMERNIKALEKIMPATIPYFKIEAQLGNNWTTPPIYQEFIGAALLGMNAEQAKNNVDVAFGPHGWRVTLSRFAEGRTEARANYGMPEVKFSKLVQHAMRFVPIRLTYYDSVLKRRVFDAEGTERANEKIQTIREYFSDWIWSNPFRRVELEKAYNESVNNAVDPQFTGDFLAFEGMMLEKGEENFNLRKHQISAIARGVILGRGLYGHEVGTGKTYTIGGIAVESRRYGKARKPLIFAHNANSATVAAEINEMYPGARVLYVSNLGKDTREIMLAQIVNEEWDAIVVPHSLANKFALRRETYAGLAAEEIAELEAAAIAAAEEEAGVELTPEMMNDEKAIRKFLRRAPTAKELVKARNHIINRIEKMSQLAAEDAIILEDAGIDMILVDEAHEFKKPPIATTMKMKGLNKDTSDRSINMMFMLKYITETRNGEGVHLFTGTPITNTLNEVYNMMRYIMPREMKAEGLFHWDSWFASFAAEQAEIEVTSAGDYDSISRLSSFINVPELRRVAGQFMDLVFADEMPEFAPRKTKSGKTLAGGPVQLKTRSRAWMFENLTEEEKDELLNGRSDDPVGRPYKQVKTVVIPMTDAQFEIRVDLQQRAQRWKKGTPLQRRNWYKDYAPESPQRILNDAANASLDARLFDKSIPDDPKSKIHHAIDNVMRHYEEHPQSTQVIFMDRGTGDISYKTVKDPNDPHRKDKIPVERLNLSKEIIKNLVKRGIPREQIGLVTAKTLKAKKREIVEAAATGNIRILIGSTQTLGTGVNIQANLRAIHHLDAPWRPGDLEQRNGRGWRQGNKWNTVLEYRYVTEGIDGRRWQAVVIKDRFITDFLRAKGDVRIIESEALDLEDNKGGDLVATLSDAVGDPRILMIAKAKKDVERLLRRERLFSQGLADTAQRLQELRAYREVHYDRIIPFREHVERTLEETKDEKFSIEIDGKTYEDRKQSEIALKGLLLTFQERKYTKIGSFRGFDLFGSLERKQYAGLSPAVYAMPFGTAPPIWELKSSGTVQGLEAVLRNNAKALEKLRQGLEDHERTVKRLNDSLNETFPQQQKLDDTRTRLAQLETELQLNPVPAPAWLRQPTPAGTTVIFRDQKRIVAGHQWNDIGFFVQLESERGHTELAPYDEILDEQGARIYDNMTFQKPDLMARASPAPEIDEKEDLLDEGERFDAGEQLGMVMTPSWPPRPFYMPDPPKERPPDGGAVERKKIKGLVQSTDIIQLARKLWKDLDIRGKATHRMRPQTLGWYNGFLALMRLKNIRDFDTLLHELGHHFDRQLKWWSKQKGLPRGIPTELIALGKALYGNRRPEGGYRAEGFAEYIRYYMAGNPEIALKAPKLHEWFTTEYLVSNKKEAAKIKQLADLVSQRIAQTSEENVEAFIEENKKDWSPQRITASLAALERLHIDMLIPIHRAMQEAGLDISKIDPDKNPYMAAIAYARTAGGRAAFSALENTIDLNGNITGEGLSNIFAPIARQGPKAIKNWKKYAVSARVLHLMKNRGLVTGLTVEDAQATFDKYDSELFRKVTQEVTDWSHRVLHLLVESGLMSVEEYNKILNDNPVYLPFMRQFIEGEKMKGRIREGGGKGVYRYKGGVTEIKDPLDMLVVQAESIWKAALQADVARMFVELAQAKKPGTKDEPLGPSLAKMLKEVPAPIEAVNFSADQIKKEIGEIAVSLGADPEEVGAAMLDTWEKRMTVFSRGTHYKGSDSIISLIIDGKRRFFEINNEGVLLALGAVSKDRFLPGKAGDITRRITGLQRLGATGLNPAFGWIRNLLRDSGTAMITSEYHFHIPVIGGIWGAMKSIAKTESSQLYNALGLNYISRINQDKFLAKKPGKTVTATNPWGRFWHGGLISGLRDIFSLSEIGPRLLEFEGAQRFGEKQGYSTKAKNILSACAAKDLTVNFSRAGSWGARLNEAVLFYNAGVQGINKLGRTIGAFEAMPWQRYQTRRGNLMKAARRGSILTIAAMALYLANKDKRWWKEKPEYEKWNYLYIDWADGYPQIRLPLPFEAGALFGSLPVAAVDGKDSFQEALGEFLRNATPISYEGRDIREIGHNLLRNIAALGPIIDIVANRDWKGDYIINPEAIKYTVRPEQYTPYTSEFAKMVGKHFPGHILSPAEIDHLLTNYTGGLYRRVAMALQPETWTGAGAGGDLSTIPVAGTLFTRPGRSRILNKFYENLDALRQKKGSGLASLEEIGWYSAGESLRHRQEELWTKWRETKDAGERAAIREEIHEQIRRHNVREDFRKIGSYSVIVSATDKQASENDMETARKLLKGQKNLFSLLKEAAQRRGWNTNQRTATLKLTPYGERVNRLNQLRIE